MNQSFDQAAVTGDGAVLAGDGSQVNTGEGAVQAGGDVEGLHGGHRRRRRLGDRRQRGLDRGRRQRRHQRLRGRLDAFGEGDATSIEAENANLGDGTIVSDTYGDATVQLGRRRPQRRRLDAERDLAGRRRRLQRRRHGDRRGNSLAFGDGSSSAEDQDTTIDDNYGNANVADDGDQTADLDASTNDSFNTEGSFLTRLSVLDGSTNGSENTYDSGNEDLTFEDQLLREHRDRRQRRRLHLQRQLGERRRRHRRRRRRDRLHRFLTGGRPAGRSTDSTPT